MTSDPAKILVDHVLQSSSCRYPAFLIRSLPDDIDGLFAEAKEAIKAWYAAMDAGQDYGAERIRVGAIAFKWGLLGGTEAAFSSAAISGGKALPEQQRPQQEQLPQKAQQQR